MLKRIVPITFFLLSVGSDLMACAVCFGGTDANLRKGFTWGVLILGSLPFLMIAGFVFSIVRASRKHRKTL